MTGYMMFILFRWSKSLKHVFHPPNTSSYNTKDIGIAYVLFISHPENVVGGFVSFAVQIITHISDKKSIEISVADSLIRKDDFNAANILFGYLLLSYCGYTWYSIFALLLLPCSWIIFWHISTTNKLHLKMNIFNNIEITRIR